MKKTLQQLTIKDNFMFAAVMCREDNCKRLLEMILGIEIERVEVDKEKCMVYHPQYKGVRLDVYAKDENNTRYNVEMQARSVEDLGKRARYYRSQIDMDMLLAGCDYAELPNSYVIFICDFDPYGERRYMYTFENRCVQNTTLSMQDGGRTIFLSTLGNNPKEVPKKLVSFLKFVRADLKESMEVFEDDYIRRLQQSIQDIKVSREMETRYMTLEQLIKDERKEAKLEGKLEGKLESKKEAVLVLLAELGKVSNEVEDRINKEENFDVLNAWIKLAAKSDSISMFEENM